MPDPRGGWLAVSLLPARERRGRVVSSDLGRAIEGAQAADAATGVLLGSAGPEGELILQEPVPPVLLLSAPGHAPLRWRSVFRNSWRDPQIPLTPR